MFKTADVETNDRLMYHDFEYVGFKRAENLSNMDHRQVSRRGSDSGLKRTRSRNNFTTTSPKSIQQSSKFVN
jgi:hypothetical protein